MRSLGMATAAALVAVLSAGSAWAEAACSNPNALGVSRTVEIDTKGGPGFGMQHYKAYDFLQPKEVVLTFDDGPQKFSTEMVLAALAEQCTKATFFSIGKMALGYPEIIREVAKAGHTIGTHTWSHQALQKVKSFQDAKDEIERGVSGVRRAVGAPIAPFFRFPTLVDTPEAVAYLGTRNIAMFSTDIDSFDFKPQSADSVVKSVIQKLEKNGKGIVLMHDIHKTTAKALPMLLAELKTKGYKIVHLTAKDHVSTLAEYDSAIEKEAKGLPQVGAERPTSSIVKTVEGTAPADEAAADAPAPSVAPAPLASPTAAPATPPQAAVTPPAAPPVTIGTAEPAAVTPVAEPAVSPVKTTSSVASPSTTASITPPSGAAVPGEPPATPSAAVPSKSMSERAKEIWELWFGK